MTCCEKLAVPASAKREAITAGAALHHVTPDELTSRCRRAPIVAARDHACWMLRQRQRPNGATAHSFPAIGDALGLHHTTVMKAVQRADERINGPQRA